MELVQKSLQTGRLDLLKIINLAVAQIALWGGSYFLLSVLSPNIMKEMHWSYQMVYAGLSLALLISGLLSPKVGSFIQKNTRNYPFLATGFVMALGLICMGSSTTYIQFLVGWTIIGVSMSMGLYDALFASLGKKYSSSSAKSIVLITLISSIGPSITWVFSSYIMENFGWRNTCYLYASILSIVIFPMHRYVFHSKTKETKAKVIVASENLAIFKSKLYYVLSINFTFSSIITTAIVVYLIDLLTFNKGETSTILLIIAFLGPSQSIARVIELALPNWTPIDMSLASAVLMLLGIILIAISIQTAIPGVILFGIGNGMRSILRGTLPLLLFDKKNYALIIGKLARMPLIVQAASPIIGGFIIQQFGIIPFLVIISIIGVMNIILSISIRKLTQ